ncbi:PREDICTED: myb-like protein X [Nicrophorus vespilloides]|uniref:Myb-like protein X n=1 Tax=Nicrophorus vespilloides TaxID=110193 RepID=A0ABM1NJG0_NICVS|nr:PREDICTED: myb-like protein X [Nicrophorus vespilloides]
MSIKNIQNIKRRKSLAHITQLNKKIMKKRKNLAHIIQLNKIINPKNKLIIKQGTEHEEHTEHKEKEESSSHHPTEQEEHTEHEEKEEPGSHHPSEQTTNSHKEHETVEHTEHISEKYNEDERKEHEEQTEIQTETHNEHKEPEEHTIHGSIEENLEPKEHENEQKQYEEHTEKHEGHEIEHESTNTHIEHNEPEEHKTTGAEHEPQHKEDEHENTEHETIDKQTQHEIQTEQENTEEHEKIEAHTQHESSDEQTEHETHKEHEENVEVAKNKSHDNKEENIENETTQMQKQEENEDHKIEHNQHEEHKTTAENEKLEEHTDHESSKEQIEHETTGGPKEHEEHNKEEENAEHETTEEHKKHEYEQHEEPENIEEHTNEHKGSNDYTEHASTNEVEHKEYDEHTEHDNIEDENKATEEYADHKIKDEHHEHKTTQENKEEESEDEHANHEISDEHKENEHKEYEEHSTEENAVKYKPEDHEKEHAKDNTEENETEKHTKDEGEHHEHKEHTTNKISEQEENIHHDKDKEDEEKQEERTEHENIHDHDEHKSTMQHKEHDEEDKQQHKDHENQSHEHEEKKPTEDHKKTHIDHKDEEITTNSGAQASIKEGEFHTASTIPVDEELTTHVGAQASAKTKENLHTTLSTSCKTTNSHKHDEITTHKGAQASATHDLTSSECTYSIASSEKLSSTQSINVSEHLSSSEDNSKSEGMLISTSTTVNEIHVQLPTYFPNSTVPIPNFETFYTTVAKNSDVYDDEQIDSTLNPYHFRSMKLKDFDRITEYQTTTVSNVSVSVAASTEITESSGNIEISVSGFRNEGSCRIGSEGNSTCICSIDNLIKDLRNKSVVGELNSSLNSYKCDVFNVPLKSGIKVGSIIHKREKRNVVLPGEEKPIGKREVVYNKDIDTVLTKDIELVDVGNHKYVSPGARVKIPCAEGKNMTTSKYDIKWTDGNGQPITEGKMQETDMGYLIIDNVVAQDGGNYTCTISNNSTGIRTFIHQLSVVQLPKFDINTTILYTMKVLCEMEDVEVVKMYFTTDISDLICGRSHKICTLEITRIHCNNKKNHHSIYVALVFRVEPMDLIIPSLNITQCNIICQMRIYNKLVSVIVHNLQVFETQPVIYHQLREVTLTPSHDNTTNETTESPILSIGCSAGFGLIPDQHICIACDPNSFSDGDEAYCSQCPKWQYQPNVGSKSCLTCTSPLQNPNCLTAMMDTDKFKLLAYSAAAVLVAMFIICLCIHGKRNKIASSSKKSMNIHDISKGKRGRGNQYLDVEKQELGAEPRLTKKRRRLDPPNPPPPDF